MALDTMIVNVILMTLLIGPTAFSHLLDLGHFLWFLLLYFLWTQPKQMSTGDFFGI